MEGKKLRIHGVPDSIDCYILSYPIGTRENVMPDICDDCSSCDRRKVCAAVNHLVCPACGSKGTIQNIFDNAGNFDTIVFSSEIRVVEVEDHSVPVCNNCGAMMEPDDGLL